MDSILDTMNKKLLALNKHKQMRDKYSKLTNNGDRVKFTLQLMQELGVQPAATETNKSIETATKLKDQANKLFTMSGNALDLDKVIELYTRSVAHAPPGSAVLALSFANRSAALFNARLFEDCLRDIDRALELDYPDNLKSKLFARKTRCLMVLRPKSPAVATALADAQKWLDEIPTTSAARKVIEKFLRAPRELEDPGKPRIVYDNERHMPKIPRDNVEIPGASSAMAIAYSKDFGRHIIATRDIETGELLALQQPYAIVLDPDRIYTHCAHCTKQTWSGIACEHCVEAIYCSETCQKAAWEEVHNVECQVIGPLIALSMSNLSLMSLRLALTAVKQAGTIQALKKEVETEFEVDSSTDLRRKGFVNGIFDDKKYASVYSLATNTEKRSAPDLFGRSLNAAMILRTLATRSTLFGEKLPVERLAGIEDDESMIFVGGLIMRHQQIVPSNAHAFTEGDDDVMEKGAALLPFYSLFNHNCNQMVNRASYGRHVAMHAIAPIKKGSQIFDNYGQVYVIMPKSLRQQHLKQQYYFDCVCAPCREDWPLFLSIPTFQNKQLSQSSYHQILIALANYPKYLEIITAGEVEDDDKITRQMIKMLNTLYHHVSLPCREVNEVTEALKRIYTLRGSRWLSLNN